MTLWKLVPEDLDDAMREVMAVIEDGPRREHDEVWAEILAASPTRVIAKEVQEELQELRDERHNWVYGTPVAIGRITSRAEQIISPMPPPPIPPEVHKMSGYIERLETALLEIIHLQEVDDFEMTLHEAKLIAIRVMEPSD